MKACPVGAVVTHNELIGIESALGEAIEAMRSYIASDTRPNRSTHDDEYRAEMRTRRDLIRVWQKHIRSVKRVRKVKP